MISLFSLFNQVFNYKWMFVLLFKLVLKLETWEFCTYSENTKTTTFQEFFIL